MALRGDESEQASQPADSDTSNTQARSENTLNFASELVQILAEDPSRDISVAAYPELHPESQNTQQDLHWLKHKLDQGASRAITQFFFSADTFLKFRDEAVTAGISQQLVPGILPIHDIAKVQDFSAKCGADVPVELVKRFSKATDKASMADCAVEQCTTMVDKLHKEGVESVHFYTLNQSALCSRVCKELTGVSEKLSPSHAAA